MRARVIVQTNEDTGQKNVVFTMDNVTPIEDFLVGSWSNSTVMSGDILLLSLDDDAIIESLLETELHSVECKEFNEDEDSITSSDLLFSDDVIARLEGAMYGNTSESGGGPRGLPGQP